MANEPIGDGDGSANMVTSHCGSSSVVFDERKNTACKMEKKENAKLVTQSEKDYARNKGN
jgi:hypothetical protein